MDINQLSALMEQFKQEGGDWDALSSRFNALSADTSPLGLRVWKSADKPRMEDFNENYQRLEEEILAQRTELAKKASLSGATYTGGVRAPTLYSDSKSQYSRVILSNDNDIALQIIADSVGRVGYIRIHPNSNDSSTYKDIRLNNNAFSPGSSGGTPLDLGAANSRWKDIYASNGTINTSDANEKKDVFTLDVEQAIAFAMALEPVSHKFKDGKRIHYGLIAQQVKEAMNSVGLTDMDFAGWIKSPVLDDEGNETGEYTYGLRYTEFIPLLLKVVQEQQKRIEELANR